MNDGPVIDTWHPPQAADMLDDFLDRLEAGTLRVGIRQRLSAHRLLATLILRGAGPDDQAYVRDMFTSLLATSPDEQQVIAAAFERDCAGLLAVRQQQAPAAEPAAAARLLPQVAPPPKDDAKLTNVARYKIAGAALILALCAVVGFMVFNPGQAPGPDPIIDTTTTGGGASGGAGGGSDGGETNIEGAWTPQQLLADLASRNPPALPTLREIWRTGWPPRAAVGERHFSLAEMVRRTGFDPDTPLEISENAVQAALIQGVGEFMGPSRSAGEPVNFSRAPVPDLIQALRDEIKDESRRATLLALVTEPRATRIAAIKAGIDQSVPEAVPPDAAVDRALAAVLANETLPADAFADADWQPGLPSAAHTPPRWLRWALAAIPLLIFAAWLWNWQGNRAEQYRRFFVRKRPLDHSLVVSAPSQILSTRTDRPYIKGIAHGLGARQTVGTIAIDPERTVDRMAKRGGFFDPVPGRVTATPAYLFFIEARSPLDLEGRRLDLLRQRLASAGLDAKRYFYTQTPAVLYERIGGPPLPLEEVAARDDDRRLIIMGEGAGFISPATLKPEPWTPTLDVWSERAMLSSKPVGSWGPEDRGIARDLGLSLGRATVEGLTALPELLGLDSEADRPQMRAYGFASGQDLKPLPSPLRSDPYRWLASAPPSERRDDWWPALEYRLSLYLDPAGLDWLKALAVYPVLNWDLTLYLGRGLRDAASDEFYAEPRLAALTRLPWLREGRMPEWLRDAMIASLDPALRKQVIELIAGIVAPEKGADCSVEALREQNRMASDLGRDPQEDSLFLDTFMEGAESRAIELPQSVQWELRFRVLKPFTAAVLLAAAAWWLTPDAASGVLRVGGYLPVAILFLTAGLGSLAVSGWPRKARDAISAYLEKRQSPKVPQALLQAPQESQAAAASAERPFIYVSFVAEDRDRVDRLTAELRAQGVNMWLMHERTTPSTAENSFAAIWSILIEALRQLWLMATRRSSEISTATRAKGIFSILTEALRKLWLVLAHATPSSPEIPAADRAAGVLSILTEASRQAGFLTNYYAQRDVGSRKPMTIVMLEKVAIEDPALMSEVLDMTDGAYGGNIEYLARKLNAQTRVAESRAEKAQVAA